MTDKEFPEKDPVLQPESPKAQGSVDFSDLGPLFAPQQEPLPEDALEPEVEFQPEEPEAEEPEEEASSQEEAVSFQEEPTEAQEEISFQPDEKPTPTVDFSDLGPLFSPEPPEVQPGEAAMVLKKLSEIPFEEPEEEDSADFVPEETTEAEEEAPAEEAPDPEELTQEEEPETVQEETEEECSEELEEAFPEDAEEAVEEEISEEEEVPVDPEEDEGADPDTEEVTLDQEEEPEQAAEETAEEAPKASKWAGKKGRPKRKKGEGFFGIPNMLVTVVWIAITVLIGVTLGRMIWVCASDVLAFGREDKPVTITIYEADTIEDITKKLHEGGLIRYPGLFKLYASLAVDEGEIHPGIWDLNTRYDYHALVNMMSPSSSREVVKLMIPEGYSCRQIFALMEEKKICTALDLASYAAEGDLGDYWFLEGVPRGDMYCLEGFLFPDTYQFYTNDSPKNVLTKMLDNFGAKFDEAMIGQIDSLNVRLADLMRKGGHNDQFIAENTFDVRDVINVASLIEKETSSADEGYVISSVIYNRLFNWTEVPYLNIDATIVYALGGKTDLTPEDLKVNSPYNTYTHTGLTPGPIANPGLASIRAALDPSDTNYYFYVLDPALGSHRFSTTYDEHKANIASIGG